MSLTYDQWFARVDRHMMARIGLGADDMPDQIWRIWFDDGMIPSYAVQLALENEGFDDDADMFELLDM